MCIRDRAAPVTKSVIALCIADRASLSPDVGELISLTHLAVLVKLFRA